MAKPVIMRESKKAAFPEILKKNKGMITLSCTELDMDRSTYRFWREKDQDFAKKCDDVLEWTADTVEHKLLTKIDQGDTASIIFYCKTKLKHRGYVERVENKDITLLSDDKLSERDEEIIERALQRRLERKQNEQSGSSRKESSRNIH